MRSRSRTPYLVAALAAAVVVIVAWTARDRLLPVGAGTDVPPVELRHLDGVPVSLSDYEGRVVLLNVWATWCLPCREEMPSMERLYQDFRGQGFEILAVSVDRPVGGEERAGAALRRQIRAFADSMGVTFPILHDPTGRVEDAFRTTGVPESFLIGPDGVIYKKVSGATEWDARQHRELIQRLLEE